MDYKDAIINNLNNLWTSKQLVKRIRGDDIPPEEDPDVEEGAMRGDHTDRSRVPEYFQIHFFSKSYDMK